MDKQLEDSIAPHFKTDFEKDLFKAAIANLDENNNVLSLNNFSYAIRELVRNFLSRLAPDEQVKGAPWYTPIMNQDGKESITRKQRMHYAIHGWLTEDILKNKLSLDVADSIDDLNTSVNNMSKYTHITSKTFNVYGAIKTMESLNMLGDLLRFLMDIDECKVKVRNAVIDDFSTRIGNSFSIETFNDIDILSTHSSIEDFGIEGYTLKELGETIEVEAYGSVYTRLQIGSNSDLSKDNGYVTHMDFPFTVTCRADIHNVLGDIQYSDPIIHIDTDKYYK